MVKFYKPKKAITRFSPKYHAKCHYIFIVPPINKSCSSVLFLVFYFFLYTNKHHYIFIVPPSKKDRLNVCFLDTNA